MANIKAAGLKALHKISFPFVSGNVRQSILSGYYRAAPLDDILKECTSVGRLGEAHFEKKMSRTDQWLYVLTCKSFSTSAAIKMGIEVTPGVEKNPDDWHFFLEAAPERNTPEGRYTMALSDRYGVGVTDFIAGDYDEEVIDRLKEQGYNHNDIHKRLMSIAFLISKQFSKEADAHEFAVERAVEESELDQAALDKLLNDYRFNDADRAGVYREIGQASLEAEIEISKTRLYDALRKHHDKKNFLIVMSPCYLPVLE